MRTPLFWYVLLVGACIVLPYMLGLRPGTRAEWLMVRGVIGFLTWLLAGLAVVRAA